MNIVDSIQRALRRAEVDVLDYGTRKIEAHRARERDEADEIALLRRGDAEDHPDLPAAIARRNAAR